MTEANAGSMTIRMMNGRILKFTYQRAGDDLENRELVQRVYEAKQLVLQLQDRTVIIPMANVMTVELSPPTKWLPAHAIRDAQMKGSLDAL